LISYAAHAGAAGALTLKMLLRYLDGKFIMPADELLGKAPIAGLTEMRHRKYDRIVGQFK